MKPTRYSGRRGAYGYVRPPTVMEHMAARALVSAEERRYRKHKIQACAYEISRTVEADPRLLELAVNYLLNK